MKNLFIFLFVMTLPVFAVDDPTSEEGNKFTDSDIYQTLEGFDRSINLHNKRERGLAWITWGVSVAGIGGATAMATDLDKELTVGIAAVGVGLAVTGCYLVFKSNKQLNRLLEDR